jgi:ATP-dependent DNA ligase
LAVFELLREKRQGRHIFLYAFDFLELNGQDLRREPLQVRKATLVSILPGCRSGVRVISRRRRRRRTRWRSRESQLLPRFLENFLCFGEFALELIG